MSLLILLSVGLCCLIRSISVIFLIAGLFSLIIVEKVTLVSLFFMFVNSLVAFWIKLFDSTDTNSPSGFANVGYMAIGAIHAQSGVDAWSV